ncbi:MAG: sigma-70 family RNA polymerase sigma factor [Rhodobacteraceae bacterium]|nr:sigma-70 family RNA polymerase sigma factor [Paracoccaceae bacterium]
MAPVPRRGQRSEGGSPLTSYEALFLAHLPLIERIARHAARGAHLRPEDVEDFLSDVKLKLLADDYRKLRECSDPAKLPGFLNITIRRLLIDKQQHDWGKWRPSAEAKRLGFVTTAISPHASRGGWERIRHGRSSRRSRCRCGDDHHRLAPGHLRRLADHAGDGDLQGNF